MNTQYIIIKEDSIDSPERDFESFISGVLKSQDTKLERISEFRYEVETAPWNMRSSLFLNLTEGSENHPGTRIYFDMEHGDHDALRVVRSVAWRQGFRVFSKSLKAYLPRNMYFCDIDNDPEYRLQKEVIVKRGFTPVYRYREDGSAPAIFYATNKAGEVCLINKDLLNYFIIDGFDSRPMDEFSYVVASDLQEFSLFADEWLIPTEFYRFYKTDIKIINLSGFDINDPGRKVFVKPLIFQLNFGGHSAYTMASDRGRVLRMDKILKGETIDDTLKRVLKDLGIGDDYLRAKVLKGIEYDRDREDVITPRLVVHVFVEKVPNDPVLRRGWVSIDDKS